MMTYGLLKFAHFAGLVLIGAGLIGVFLADLRTRQTRTLPVFAEAVRNIALCYDGLVVPGALLLLISGTWLIVTEHGGWHFLEEPWLAGMVVLFLFEFIEGNTGGGRFSRRLQGLPRAWGARGRFTPELLGVRGARVPPSPLSPDPPLLMVIVALGALRPDGWGPFAVG